jgi:hypothetical protein
MIGDDFALTHDRCKPGWRKISDGIQPSFRGAAITDFHLAVGTIPNADGERKRRGRKP